MPSHDPLPESRGVHVLVADDNEDIRLDIGQLLQPKRRGALAERALRLFPEEAARFPAGGAPAPGFPVPSGDGTRAFRVDGAANGDQALAIARAAREAGWPIAVAFVDVRMPPGIDGARVARLLLEEDRDIEVVLITAYADRTLAELNATAGGPDRLLFLKKPYARDEVYQLAVSLSEKWSQRRALRSARERLELVLASTKDGLLGLDSSHGIVFSNPSARALLGLGESETGKELWPRLAALSPHALPGRAGLELQVGRRWLEISDVARTRSPGSEVQGVLGIHDVTARKELERLKDEFVQNTSHELRTPLVSICGYLDLALQGSLGQLEPQLRRGLEIAKRSSARLLDLIDAILELSRLEATEDEEIEKEDVDLAETARRAAEALEPAALAKGLALQLDLAADAAFVLANERTLEVALRNLLGNGVKFTERGSVGIRTRAEKGKVKVEVWDTGPGLPDDVEADALFERFRQGRGGMSRTKGGVGIGLSLVARILKFHGSSVTAANREGGGAVFRFVLDRAGEKAPRPTPAVKPGPSSVLVLDRSPETREFLRFALSAAGHSVRTGSPLDEAVPPGDGPPPDVALVELGEGGIGARVARVLQDRFGERAPRIALLVPPGCDPRELEEAQRSSKAFAIVEKPVAALAASALLTKAARPEAPRAVRTPRPSREAEGDAA